MMNKISCKNSLSVLSSFSIYFTSLICYFFVCFFYRHLKPTNEGSEFSYFPEYMGFKEPSGHLVNLITQVMSHNFEMFLELNPSFNKL